MKVAGDWLADAATQAVLGLLAQGGHRALVVGGCVRNALLGLPVTDIDIATDARPDRVTALAEALGLRAVPTGIDHGTVTVVAGGRGFEVTTFRRDVATDGRRATVVFSDRLEEDAARRDFTMNALYADAAGAVQDPLGGLPDLMARRVRFVGDPSARIAEDALRILRLFRFHAWYGDPAQGIDAEALAACAAGLDGLDLLSAERVTGELRKLLSAPDPAPAMAAMAACGVLARVLPGAVADALAPLVHLEGGLPPDWLRRMSVLGAAETGGLRLSRTEARGIDDRRAAIASGDPAAVLAYRLGAGVAADAVLAQAALAGQPPPAGWQAAVARGAAAVMPVTAADLMPALSGPGLGQALRRIERRWIASDFTLSRADLLDGA
jgi:poly(A) polymerase